MEYIDQTMFFLKVESGSDGFAGGTLMEYLTTEANKERFYNACVTLFKMIDKYDSVDEFNMNYDKEMVALVDILKEILKTDENLKAEDLVKGVFGELIFLTNIKKVFRGDSQFLTDGQKLDTVYTQINKPEELNEIIKMFN